MNTQVGENLVTNPEGDATPEELLISPRNPRTDQLIRRSSMQADGGALLSAAHLLSLRRALRVIHAEFHRLYGVADAPFAMEVEFKVTRDGQLFIKQARPWVF